MTGGAGFSRHAIDASKENRNLRKIRPERTSTPESRKIEGSNPTDLRDAIIHQQSKRSETARKSKVIYFLILLLLTFGILVFWLFG